MMGEWARGARVPDHPGVHQVVYWMSAHFGPGVSHTGLQPSACRTAMVSVPRNTVTLWGGELGYDSTLNSPTPDGQQNLDQQSRLLLIS